MTEYIYYVNGSFVPASTAAIGLNDLGLVRGYGVFEVLRTYGVTPFHLHEHLERLQRSASQIDWVLPWSTAELEMIVFDTLARNDPTNVAIRIIVTGGASASFLMPDSTPSLMVLLTAVKPFPEEIYATGARLLTVDLPHFMPTVKSINYITAIMGQQRAKRVGAIEALYCGADGVLTECTTSNLFVFQGDRLCTPGADVLPGITRAAVLEIASDLFEIELRPLHYAELATASEVFITSTTKEIMPIVRVDDITIGDGRVGSRTQRLHSLFRASVEQLCVPA